MKKILVLFLLLVSLSLLACTTEEKVDIYTTVYPVEFITREIVGDKLKVASVYPRGKDVHDYEPQPKKIISIAQADALFYIGLNLEPFIDNALESAFKDLNTIRLSDIPNLELIEYGHNEESDHSHPGHVHGAVDPHIWMYPLILIPITEKICSELIKIHPEHQELFTENANRIIAELKAIDLEYKTFLDEETIASKTILVVHDAFGYWGHFYGIKRLKINHDTNSNDSGASLLQANIEAAKNLNIKYIAATKNVIISDIVITYQKALNAETTYLHTLETITNEEFNNNENYFTIMRDNLAVLKLILPRKS